MNRQLLKRPLLLIAAIATVAFNASSRQPERGYRGFVEWSNRYASHSNVKWGGYTWSYTEYFTGLSTSHGYQFNPWIFVGAGIDYEIDHKDLPQLYFYDYKLSFFLQGRTDLRFGIFTPFADVRIGYNANASQDGKLYFSPSIGYRFDWGRKVGINVGVGYTLDTSRYQEYIQGMTPEGYATYVPTGIFRNHYDSYLSFRVGIDF